MTLYGSIHIVVVEWTKSYEFTYTVKVTKLQFFIAIVN